METVWLVCIKVNLEGDDCGAHGGVELHGLWLAMDGVQMNTNVASFTNID